jgi:hypothetical protein
MNEIESRRRETGQRESRVYTDRILKYLHLSVSYLGLEALASYLRLSCPAQCIRMVLDSSEQVENYQLNHQLSLPNLYFPTFRA